MQDLKVTAADCGRQLAESQVEVGTLREEMALVREKIEEQSAHVRELELRLAQAETKALTIEQISTGLRAVMDQTGHEAQVVPQDTSDASTPAKNKSQQPAK